MFKKQKTSFKVVSLIISIAIAELAGIIGSIFTTSNIGTWYSYLNKPSFNPPAWLFAPVWLALYALMGLAVWLVWQKRTTKNIRSALVVYGVQLFLNALWSILFFGQHNLLAGLIEIIFLWALIIKTIYLFAKVDKTAAWLLAPYLLWVTFAMILNFAIWKLN